MFYRNTLWITDKMTSILSLQTCIEENIYLVYQNFLRQLFHHRSKCGFTPQIRAAQFEREIGDENVSILLPDRLYCCQKRKVSSVHHVSMNVTLCLQDIERLQKEIQHLNDTVFSKTFKAPSAWADREVKYKMEKRTWELELQGLKERLKGLQDENEGYRAANRAAEFEETVKASSYSYRCSCGYFCTTVVKQDGIPHLSNRLIELAC